VTEFRIHFSPLFFKIWIHPIFIQRTFICRVTDWFKASQWLYAIAVVLIVLASVMVLSVGCLRKTVGTTIAKVAGSLMIIAGKFF